MPAKSTITTFRNLLKMLPSTALMLATFGSASAGVINTTLAAHYSCFNLQVPMSFNALSQTPGFAPFQNHYESVALLEQLTSRSPQEYPPFIVGAKNVSVQVTIAAQYCSPHKSSNGIVQILTHGLGFDHTYWNFGGYNSENNYIKAATEAGYSTLSYDRIGNGNSTKSDPYTINQLGIQTTILAILTSHLRNRDIASLKNIPAPRKVVHVGHSYGSQLSVSLVSQFPNSSDGLVLTGFAENSTAPLLIASNFHLAKEVLPRQYGQASTGYLTWRDELANQYSFLHYPNFSPSALSLAEQMKSPFTVGEILTGKTPVAAQFTGPVLILTGHFDRVFCDDDCTGVLDQAKVLTPAANPFETYMQPNTGHGINVHYNASGAYNVIQGFLDKQF